MGYPLAFEYTLGESWWKGKTSCGMTETLSLFMLNNIFFIPVYVLMVFLF